MCKPEAEGGQRCAAHTRPRFDAARPTDESWWTAASEYASTSEGHTRLSSLALQAQSEGNPQWEAQLRAAVLRGESLKEANLEAVRLMKPGRPRTVPQEDIAHVAAQFGVAKEQVLRDHAISHILAALTRMKHAKQLIFFGGTALSRTFLPTLRLSEDIDLITRLPRADMAAEIELSIQNGLRRSHGDATWSTGLIETKGSEAAVLRVGKTIQIRIQLISQDGYPAWPTQEQSLIQRYSDAPEARLETLTPPAFVANKTATWLDRKAPRDLYDLWALAQLGAINAEALALFERHGPTGSRPRPWMFDEAPAQTAWQDSLNYQGQTRVSADQALSQVRGMWLAVSGES